MKNFNLNLLLNNDDTYNSIVFIPIRNFQIDNPIKIAEAIFVPGELIDKNLIMSNSIFLDLPMDDFFKNTFCILPSNFSSEYPFNSLTTEARNLFDKSISICDQYMNLFKFLFCNIDYSTTIPSKPGYIGNSLSMILLYKKNTGTCNIFKFKSFIKENNINPLVISKNKYNDEIIKFSCIFSKNSHDVGNIIKAALNQYANIISSENKTTKFILSMTSLEFLANPFEYIKMMDVKKFLTPFITENIAEANYILDFFKFLTSFKDENKEEKGLRTNIVHLGKTIEELVPKLSDVDFILRTLQKYICNILKNYLTIYDKEWNEVSKLKNSRQATYSNSPYDPSNEIGDTVILIDLKFLNNAINEVQSLYDTFKFSEIDTYYFLQLIVKQSYFCVSDKKIPVIVVCDNESKLDFNIVKNEFIVIFENISSENYYNKFNSILDDLTFEKNNIFELNLLKKSYNNIICISDYGKIDVNFLERTKINSKNLVMGQLDKYRSTIPNGFIFFNIIYFITSYYNIPLHFECTGELIFK